MGYRVGISCQRWCPRTGMESQATQQRRRFRRGTGLPSQSPIIAHEQGQWCAFPDFKEIPQYTGAYKASNFEIFRDLLRDHGMASQAEKFLLSSGRLQVLAYKYEIERNMRTSGYAGFQLLALNDYSGQGTALVGPLNVHWGEKGYCTSAEWREFCDEVVPLARLPRFTFQSTDTIHFNTLLYNTTDKVFSQIRYTISDDQHILLEGTKPVGQIISWQPKEIQQPTKLTLTLFAGEYHNHYNLWVYPDVPAGQVPSSLFITTSPDSALSALAAGKDVLLCAAGKIRYGADVVHHFLPVFWNTSWFKMRQPHTNPSFRDFPTDDWQDLQWWELTNRAQCMNLAQFPADYQPIVQPIDTWHLSRKLGMLLEARVLRGRLLLTTFDILSALDRRIVARQLRQSTLRYMTSSDFQPSLVLEPEVIRNLFEHEAPSVNMFTNESPDELKPKLQNP